MSQLDNIQFKLSKGTTSWLEYEFSCDRGNLFNEKYLSFPIGNILNSITDCMVLTEINHPAIKKLKVGRPLQIDFVLHEKGSKSKWKYVVESKWTGTTEPKLEDIFWDLIRLQNIFEYQKDAKCYFVFSGFLKKLKTSKISPLFTEAKDGPSKSKVSLITRSRSFYKIELKHLDKTTKKNLNEKKNKYGQFKMFSEIVIRTPHIFPIFDIDKKEEIKGIINMSLFTCAFEVMKPNANKRIPFIL